MRNKIEYGIDLGTTNSAIARMENGVPVVKKSDTLKDTLPSCVHFNKKQEVLVGDSAYNVMKTDNTRALKNFQKGKTNTFIEFKRTMGTTHTYESSNMNKSFSSEELSAEVLKTLKSFITDENISSIVITVPAQFLNPQKDATVKAGKMAGFTHIELLQEPVAAATAYGLDAKKKDGFWLVFDFGGGTFDSALIKAQEGILSVKDTAGDNWLGGKNIDEAIVDKIIIPNLQERFSIDSVINDSVKLQILRDAVKVKAEEAKIQMSFKDSHHILSDLGDLPFVDDNGEEPEIDVLVTQKEMEDVVSPIFQKTIDITKDLLKRNNLKGSDLGALILVGGPTYSPILRRMLKEQVTEKVDTSIDPMTAVAKGAALFASTLSLSDEVIEETRDKTKLQLELKYESATVDLEGLINIKILKNKSTGTFPEKLFAELTRFDGAWSSGKKPISERAVLIEVLLVEGRANSFDIIVYDNQGNKMECQPNQLSILQGIGGLSDITVLPYHIGIGKYFHLDDKDLFMPVKGLEKNKPISNNGVIGVINGLKTRTTIRPGIIKDIIRIPIYQGDYNAEGTNPLLNNFINEVIISGESLPGLLPEGSDVDITIKVDRSEQMNFSAFFPLLNHTEELKVDIKAIEPPTEEELNKEISQAQKRAEIQNDNEIIDALNKLEDQLENEKGSADGKMKILDGLRRELLKLENVEKTKEFPEIEKDLKDAFFDLEDLISKIKSNNDSDQLNMGKIEAHLQEYKKTIELIIKEKDSREAKKLTEEIRQMDFEIRNAVTGNGLVVNYLRYIDNNFNSFHWKDRNKARTLTNQGLQKITEGKTNEIRPIIISLIALMPDDEKPKETLE